MSNTDSERFLYSGARSHDPSLELGGATIAVSDDLAMRASPRSTVKTGCVRNVRERNWCVAFTVVTVILFILIIALATQNRGQGVSSPSASDLCITDDCVKLSSSMLLAMNQSVDPCVDFYKFACGSWADGNPMPSDRSRWSNFDVLSEKNQYVVKALIEKQATELPSDNPTTTDPYVKAAQFYQACMDAEQADDAAGIDLVKAKELTDEVTWTPTGADDTWTEADRTSLAKALATVHKAADGSPLFAFWVSADDKNSTTNIINLYQSGLGLPDRSYYNISSDVGAYQKFITDVFTLAAFADVTDVSATAKAIADFETALAAITIDRDLLRDPDATYLKLSKDELFARFPPSEKFDWNAYFGEFLPDDIAFDSLLMPTRDYFDKLFPLLDGTSQTTIMNYIRWHRLKSYVSLFSKPYRDAAFEFSKVLSGVDSLPPRWKTCMGYTDGVYGFVLGSLFVEQTFSGSSRTTADEMIGDIRASFKDGLSSLDWMDDITRELAAGKADAIVQKIGYPDFSLNSTALSEYYNDVQSNDVHLKNVLASRKWDSDREIDDLSKPVDKLRWGMTPPTVNAYYNPSNNEIVFPAGIMQPPFFAATNMKAVNYGGIGVVMGHELTHGFDDQGRNYDKDGNLMKWWSEDVASNFEERAQCISEFYSQQTIQMPNGTELHVNGNLTNGENIADNGGLKQALVSYRGWVNRNGAEKRLVGMSQFSAEQMLILGFSQVWCSVSTPERAQQALLTDPHSPTEVRVRATLKNSPDFAKVWNCPLGSPMNPEKKCQVW